MRISFLAKVERRTHIIQLVRTRRRWGVEQLAVCVLLGLALASLRAAMRSEAVMPLLLGVHELVVAVLVWRQYPNRAPDQGRQQHLMASFLAWVGIALPLLLRPMGAAPSTTYLVGNMLQLAGSLLALVATLTLGRHFGIIAAHRGVQMGGLYRLVRHPLYLAYVISNGGFVLAYPHLSNVAVLVLWVVVQAFRALVEERVLLTDIAYRAYTRRVRYRFVPGVW